MRSYTPDVTQYFSTKLLIKVAAEDYYLNLKKKPYADSQKTEIESKI